MTSYLESIQRIKPLSHFHIGEPTTSLRPCLSLVDLLAYGVGCSVGAGVYSLVGVGALLAGPAVSLSFLISGITCIFTSLTYSEFAASLPVTGSAYTFVYITFGELAAWLIGWNLTLGYGISAAGIARSWAVYAELFLNSLGIRIPSWLVLYPLESLDISLSLLSCGLILVCTIILLAGVRESAKCNVFITFLNISVLCFVIIYGSIYIEPANWDPFAPEKLSGVMRGAGVVFFAYLGFDMVACLAEEVKDPQKNLPRGIIGSLLISMSIYVGISLVVTGMAPVDILGGTVPLVNAFLHYHLHSAALLVSCGSMFGLTTATFTCLMGQPRIFYQMAKDGLLPQVFANINSTTKVPFASTIGTGILVGAMSLIFDLNFLANVISCGTLQVFTFVNAGVLVLRLSIPSRSSNTYAFPVVHYVLFYVIAAFGVSIAIAFHAHWILLLGASVCLVAIFLCLNSFDKAENTSTFQCPYVPLIPCLGIMGNVYMMTSLSIGGWIGVFIWLLIGCVIYLGYGIKHSKLNESMEKKRILNNEHADKY